MGSGILFQRVRQKPDVGSGDGLKKQDGPEQTEEKERGYMKKVQIRQASIGDLDAVTGIEADCFAPAEAADRESLKARLGKFPGSFLVAECGGEIAGFINGAVTDERTIADEMFENVSLHDPNEIGRASCRERVSSPV